MEPKICCRMRGRSARVLSLRRDTRMVRSGIANGIQGPEIYKYENLPLGPSWEEVKKLLKSVKGQGQAALRARAILSLLAIYGLRSGEVSRLDAERFRLA